MSDLAFLKAEKRLCGCWRKDTLGDAGAAIRFGAPHCPYIETGIESWKLASFRNGRLNSTYGLFAPPKPLVTGARPSVASADWLTRISQCAPMARITDVGRFHPDNFRLV